MSRKIVLGVCQKNMSLILPYKKKENIEVIPGVPVQYSNNGVSPFNTSIITIFLAKFFNIRVLTFLGVSGYIQADNSINIIRKGIGIGVQVETQNTDLTGKQVFINSNGSFTDDENGNLKLEGAIFSSEAQEEGLYIDNREWNREEGFKVALIDLV